jgi:Glycosyltransferase GT-D fold
MSELQTLDSLCTDTYGSLARYGDGDFAVMRGQQDRYQKFEPKLAHALARSLAHPHPGVLNAVIPAPAEGPGSQRWICFWEANAGIIGMLPDREYGSANLSRLDSCPALHTAEYWLSVSRLWAGKKITLVRGSERSLTANKLLDAPGAPSGVHEIYSTFRHSWSMYDDLLQRTREAGNETVILCTGLVARPLVHALAQSFHRAIDLGHLGLWFENGLPIAVERP